MDRQLKLLGIALLLVAGSACRREAAPASTSTAPNPPRVSPVPNRPFTGEVKVAFPDLSVEPDAASSATRDASRSPAATDSGAAATASAELRRKTEKAFDQVLRGAMGGLKGCLDEGASGSGEAKLNVRLRAGAVFESKVTGVPSSVATCIGGVLQTLRVRDGASMTIERGIKYSEPKK